MNKISLFQHQKTVLEQTKDFNKVAYYLDMGLGKTFVGAEKAIQMNKNILLVCQKSKIEDWKEHFIEYYAVGNVIYDLTNKKELNQFINIDIKPWLKIGIINYDLVFRRPDLLNLKDFTLMLDESSLIQNEDAKRSKFILKMNPANVILLSGTPTSGKYENLWTQAHLLGWKISENVYQKQYVNWKKIDVGGVLINTVDKDNPYKNVDRLKNKLKENGAVFMKTEECFDLPKQNFIDIKVNSSKEYRKFKKDRIIVIDDNELVGDTKFSQILCERQLCGMYSKEKLQAFKDIAESTKDRLIVFYNFNKEVEQLKVIAEELERPISIVNGKIKDLKAYEENDDSITFIQYQAGAMGLNLQKANKIIYFTLPLMSELFEQSKKRIHRIGQTKPCYYYTLTIKNSIEKDIKNILEMRKDYTDELFR